jgi:hypothetical protein
MAKEGKGFRTPEIRGREISGIWIDEYQTVQEVRNLLR